ncbi:MAG: beta-lactamase family protein [Saprospiraceae bacterium]|nr:beta-lactamase family protein [Saprospiraceae bacterium]MCF8249928.1 beta-lactamase family protein [Saprospiraceae bacterium]MCF8279341.1 beta-lactamase family protein [Bacteroidales bacterium]MCF8310032.1 beta-lactamase family protein [Saprospiraceae bacterium]MCF8438932.1 beta-lactamase family protein [Saprospiraceae bacterium]
MNFKTFLTYSFLFAATSFLFAQSTPNIAEQLKTALDEAAQNGWSGSVIVTQNGKMLVENGYGLADRESKKPQTAQTVFSIGSITKQFTAAAILKLECMGKLSTDDILSKYFPDAPAEQANIRLHQLLTHTAGFPGAIGDDYENVDAAAFAKLAFESPLGNPPGKVYEYSNVGFSLLGIIVEQVSGVGYEQFLRENLWLPAGMNSTGYLLPKFPKENLAVGYRNDKRWGTAMDRPWMSDGPSWHLRANGGVLSTVGDMHRWYLSLKNNTVLPKTATDKLFTPYVAEGPEGHSHYGYGWVVQDLDGEKLIWHNGGNGVYNANMTFIPAQDICIVASSNSNSRSSDNIAMRMMGILLGKDFGGQEGEEMDYMDNPVTNAIYNEMMEKGATNFRENSLAILKNAGFDNEDDMLLLGVGERLLDEEKWQEGLALYEVYTRLFPKIIVSWTHLGRCRKELGDVKGAKAAWETSVSLRPKNNPAVSWLKAME